MYFAADIIEGVVEHIGMENVTHIKKEHCDNAEKAILAILQPLVPSFRATQPTEDCRINHQLLELWQIASKDPDHAAVSWMLHGAPGGIELDVPSCGIFPTYKDEADPREISASSVYTPQEFVNYEGVEESEDAA